MEIRQLNIKLIQQAGQDIVKENHDLKRCLEVLETERKALKIKLVQQDQMDIENSVIKPEDNSTVMAKMYFVKMLLKFFKQR